MIILRSRAAAALAAAAALSLTATPAMARGWHRHGDGIDGGDVVAGLLIFGGIAAIAAAASSKSNKDRQARADDGYRDDGYRDDGYRDDRDYRDDGQHYVPPASRYSPGTSNWRSGVSVDGAVDACVGEVERGTRSIDSIEAVNRDGDGWRVSGRVRGGNDFACSVAGDGRVRSVSGL
ncbi:hypothetical protein KRR38_29645 [Novosphingobium sp. G106]|uniref:hypothetical protein n=1 Tax=Novosphingobium sp. G106 TaxID=2849500 RepID=UPI001C2CF6DC|nr:hypothetical protein [Novosphingobium sp. G106]MBV1691731.1 hypothetical protein [Novosphingobium sp. G106]